MKRFVPEGSSIYGQTTCGCNYCPVNTASRKLVFLSSSCTTKRTREKRFMDAASFVVRKVSVEVLDSENVTEGVIIINGGISLFVIKNIFLHHLFRCQHLFACLKFIDKL